MLVAQPATWAFHGWVMSQRMATTKMDTTKYRPDAASSTRAMTPCVGSRERRISSSAMELLVSHMPTKKNMSLM